MIEGPILRVWDVVRLVQSIDRGIRWKIRKTFLGNDRWRYVMTPLVGSRFKYQNQSPANRRRERKELRIPGASDRS